MPSPAQIYSILPNGNTHIRIPCGIRWNTLRI